MFGIWILLLKLDGLNRLESRVDVRLFIVLVVIVMLMLLMKNGMVIFLLFSVIVLFIF